MKSQSSEFRIQMSGVSPREISRSLQPAARCPSFTLIELMVAIAIMIIVVGIFIKAAASVNEKAKISRTQNQIKMLSEAVTAFKNATGYYPLAVPHDAWSNNWSHTGSFADKMGWKDRWTDYFHADIPDGDEEPDYVWPPARPTNIHMLAFQLDQVPESKTIMEKIKQQYVVQQHKAFKVISSKETWEPSGTKCRLVHPLDNQLHPAYQPQDAWGTPLRYWSSDILKWADTSGWDPSIQKLLSAKLQSANWGFFIESAGKDGKFGWWGDGSATFTGQQAEDNIYSN